ncbi:hypothetical protein Tcan_00519, partial [Toxocara canis]
MKLKICRYNRHKQSYTKNEKTFLITNAAENSRDAKQQNLICINHSCLPFHWGIERINPIALYSTSLNSICLSKTNQPETLPEINCIAVDRILFITAKHSSKSK